MQWSLDGIRMCAWMWSERDAIEHGCNQDVGRNDMVMALSGAGTYCWCGHACFGNRVDNGLKIIMLSS